MISIDLQDTYQPIRVVERNGFQEMQFWAPQKKGEDILMHIRLSPHKDRLLPGVFNMALGPIGQDDSVNDMVRLNHANPGKVLSTAILFSYVFLMDNKDMMIGIDGSDDLRAVLYHSMFTHNRDYLSQFFLSSGVDWYVKLLRNRVDIERNNTGLPFFKPKSEPFDYSRNRKDLYRYYMFKLN